jgi:hypothetical protein
MTQLVVGNPGLSISEQQSQFSLWAIFAAPLLMSADLRTIPQESRQILLNQEIIAVNQDILGRQGWCAEQNSLTRVWVRELRPSSTHNVLLDPALGTSDRWAVVLQNAGSIFNSRNITFDPSRHLNTSSSEWRFFSVRDLIQRKDLGIFESTFSALVDESSVAMFIVAREGNVISIYVDKKANR